MHDMFGQDGVKTEGAGTGTPPPTGGGTMTATAPTPVAVAPVAAPVAALPTLDQTVAKAVGKANADAVVATDPHAVHHVVLAAASPKVLGSTGAGAGIGFLLGGPPGALLGAGIGFVSEKWQIAGGPSGVLAKVKAKWQAIAKPTA
jgi:hypothetical protein